MKIALKHQMDEMSFFDPVYSNDQIEMSDEENDLLADGIPRPSFEKSNRNESNETLRSETIINQDQSSEVNDYILETRRFFLLSRFR